MILLLKFWCLYDVFIIIIILIVNYISLFLILERTINDTCDFRLSRLYYFFKIFSVFFFFSFVKC